MPTAVVIDGAFFLRRFNSVFAALDASHAADVAVGVPSMAAYHVAFRVQATTVFAVDRWRSDGFTPTDDDFELDVVQKGVDLRLGLDIPAMAYKRRVDQIALVAAEADCVPPAKLARPEGVDVVLDPMRAHAASDLLQHVAGVRTCYMPNLFPNLDQAR